MKRKPRKDITFDANGGRIDPMKTSDTRRLAIVYMHTHLLVGKLQVCAVYALKSFTYVSKVTWWVDYRLLIESWAISRLGYEKTDSAVPDLSISCLLHGFTHVFKEY